MKMFQNRRPQFVPVTLENGVKASVQTATISDWTTHHGQTIPGVKVNSLLSKQVGNSIIIAKSADGPAFSVTKDDLEVFAAQYLKGIGYSVSPQTQK